MSDSFTIGKELITVTVYKVTTRGVTRNVGRVTQNKDTIDNVIAELARRNIGMDKITLKSAMDYITEEVCRRLEAGRAVDMNGLGVFRVVVDGAVEGDTPYTATIKGFKVRYTPSVKTQDAVSKIKVDKFVFYDASPLVSSIVDIRTSRDDWNITEGTCIDVKGDRLKVAGTDSGIFFAPVSGGVTAMDESLWKAVDMSQCNKNTNSLLRFFIPLNVSAGADYRMVIRTRFVQDVQSQRQQLVQCITDIIHIL